MSLERVKVGDYGYEIYRFSINIEGGIERQGKAIEGKIVSIKKNKSKRVVLAEIESKTNGKNHFIPIKFITNDKKIFDYFSKIDTKVIEGNNKVSADFGKSHKEMQGWSIRALKAEEFISDITTTPWWKFNIRRRASDFLVKLHLK